MLQFPSEWIQHFGVNLATGYPRDLGARFRYFERLRPQPSFSKIVDRMLASDPEFRVHQVGEMLRLVTIEGEYGAFVAIEGRREGSRAMRYIAGAFLDDFATALDVIAVIPNHFGQVERLALDLARSQRFEMYKRPRRFFYVPPRGWHSVTSGVTAHWYPLDFPKNLTAIVVPPASVVEVDAETAIDATFADAGGGLVIDSSARDELSSASGVKGAFLRLSGRRAGLAEPIFREMAMYVVGSYAYRMRLETANASKLPELREMFHGVARSFRPLPSADESRAGRAFAAATDLFDHWAM